MVRNPKELWSEIQRGMEVATKLGCIFSRRRVIER